MSNELTIIPPQEIMRQATDIAGACKAIVTKTAIDIQGRKYVKCEGWQSIATTYGCVASARDVERIEGGFRATGEVRRISDGIVLATAEGFVGDDESAWNKRPEFARRAMAQTRAISRACRSAFAFIVVMMDAGLETTPAEEMEPLTDKDSDKEPPKAIGNGSKSASKPSAAPQQRQGGQNASTDGWRAIKIHFGKNSGVPLGELKENQLQWYQVIWQPDAARTSQKDQDLRDALDDSIKELADDSVLRGAFKTAIQKFAEEKKMSESELDSFNQQAADYIKQSEPDTEFTDVKSLNAVHLQLIFLKRESFLDAIRETTNAE